MKTVYGGGDYYCQSGARTKCIQAFDDFTTVTASEKTRHCLSSFSANHPLLSTRHVFALRRRHIVLTTLHIPITLSLPVAIPRSSPTWPTHQQRSTLIRSLTVCSKVSYNPSLHSALTMDMPESDVSGSAEMEGAGWPGWPGDSSGARDTEA